MLKQLLPLAAIVAAATAVAAAGKPDTLTAGRWEIRTSDLGVAVNGKAQPPDPRGLPPVEYKCISAETAASPTRYFTKQATNMCKPNKVQVKRGKINISSDCTYEEGATEKSSLAGSYTATSFSVAMKSANAKGNESMQMSGKIAGKYLGTCTGDEAK